MYIQAILAVIASIPKIVDLVTKFVGWAERQWGPNWPEALAKLDKTIEALEHAKTVEDRVGAARELSRILKKV